MKTSIYVLTAPRDTADPFEYLRHTVDQIDRQESQAYRAIVVDGMPGDLPRFDGWDVIRAHKEGPGNRNAWFSLFEAAVTVGGAALCFEDDIEICAGGVKRMVDFQVPADLAAVRFFTPRVVAPSYGNGLHRLPLSVDRKQGALFLQALKWRPEALIALSEFRGHPDYHVTPSADQTVGKACSILGLSIASHKPDLVQHVGHKSKMTPDTNRLPWWKQADEWEAELEVKTLDPALYV